MRYEYTIAADGNYTYKLGGMLNNRLTNDDDSGVVEFRREFVTLKGHRHVNTFRFGNLQQTLDGSTVLTLWPPVDMSKITSSRESVHRTGSAKKW